ncbi:anthranilate synthase component I [Brevibacillus fluminis]|uniref:Anthranilate synthase component 1 n=1 Tax=Brevibacillus fluminis TaxID=511487 RepID=A0A3M8D2G1_9BACL|nr:anthranilate synthase component I [Brevibacillus fluminis]RNB81637.1 anthranilate synthase component I [Brevibacillus fluminis]
MFTPTFAEVTSLAPQYSMIPIRMTVLADQETPIRLYQKIRTDNSFLLESVEGGSRWARYSFIGLNPFETLEAKGTAITLSRRDTPIVKQEGNPIELLRERMKQYRSPQLADYPRFSGGAVGFFGYNTLHYYEELPAHKREVLDVPDLRFLFVDELIAFDHLKQEIQVIVNLHIEGSESPEELEQKYKQTCERIRELAHRITDDAAHPEQKRHVTSEAAQASRLTIKSNMSKPAFEQMVERAKDYIAAGDIFQVVLSQRFTVDTALDPFSVYRVLRTLNPSPYMYYLQYADTTLVGTSPEILVRVEDNKVEIRPIAGTRKRGATAREDEELAKDLLADEKERAEHTMLLDLGRNDVGRVARYGSVKVEEQMVIEQYSHVMHMVSHVSGQLRDDLDPFDAVLSAFPAGTVSGAPKLRAMEIIAELEPDARHTYAGSIGYLSFTGNMDTCITIRTILFKDNQAHIQAGGGIVADSIPEMEYQESVNKASAMFRALEKAEQLFRREGENVCSK